MTSSPTRRSRRPDRQPRLLTPDEAAAYLAISPRTLRTLAARGDIGRRYLGSSPRYERTDLDAYVDSLPETRDDN
ncbi:helix-turn-helix domain-containing protein [Pseudactinotalea sp. HY158]|uniref:helix-turn-helix domain-containing protein n=1 Tax=Pseudactinotalea sp. HY158 TaxID=2654547 RepID=UPI00129C2571|nr:helix-turn-helix domain-containing protein [Pseudactinotalea sp. HY158]